MIMSSLLWDNAIMSLLRVNIIILLLCLDFSSVLVHQTWQHSDYKKMDHESIRNIVCQRYLSRKTSVTSSHI